MTELDQALLELTTATRRTLVHRPLSDQVTIRAAMTAVVSAARREAEGSAIDAADQLRTALDRMVEEHGWSAATQIVNARGRSYAGRQPRRAAG